jgi:hypothetical protein
MFPRLHTFTYMDHTNNKYEESAAELIILLYFFLSFLESVLENNF